jgi:Helix-turn-helix.
MDELKIPRRIRGYINNIGLKQRVVAQRSGYTEKQFSAMMTGRKKITAVDIERICLALNVSPSEFIKPESQKAG